MKPMRNLLLLMLSAVMVACMACNKAQTTGTTQEPEPEPVYTEDVEYYEFSPYVPESTIYAVRAAGKYIKVLPTIEPHLAWLGVNEGKVKFEISLQSGTIETVDIRPLGKDYDYTIENNKIIIGLGKYDKISVEINGDIKNPLFIFVNPIDEVRPSKDDPSVRYFEAGQIYEEGSITLTESCKEVYFEPGTYVKGHIFATDVEGVKIHGGGFLDTQENDVGRYLKEFYQPFSVALNRCPNSHMSDYTHLFGWGGWGSLFTNCDGSTITNVNTVCTESSPGVKTNNDSMDIIGGKNVRVKQTFLYGHDDCFCLKSQKFLLKGDVDGIYYEDCIGWNVDAGNTFVVGYETNIDVKNVHFKDCYSIHSGTSGTDMRRGAFSIHNGAAGTISNVTFENIWIEDAMEFCIWLGCDYHKYNIGYDDEGNKLVYSPGKVDGVTFTNVNVLSVRPNKGDSVIRGYNEEYNISNVTFNNFQYLGRKVTSMDDDIWSDNLTMYYNNIIFN